MKRRELFHTSLLYAKLLLISLNSMKTIDVGVPEAIGSEINLSPKRRNKDIHFHGEDILPGNWLFKHFILMPDIKKGIRSYEANR